jgi:hypothetical protein
MRVLSKPVVDCAETITRRILDAYLEPDKSFIELRKMSNESSICFTLQHRMPAGVRRHAISAVLSEIVVASQASLKL